MSSGYAYAHEWSNDLVFAGTLSGIPADKYADNGYPAGIYAYTASASDEDGFEHSFIVVSYFVE